jgi:hypothetical protein
MTTTKKYPLTLNFRPDPCIVEGIDEVVEYLRSIDPVEGRRVTKTDALRYLISEFQKQRRTDRTNPASR